MKIIGNKSKLEELNIKECIILGGLVGLLISSALQTIELAKNYYFNYYSNRQYIDSQKTMERTLIFQDFNDYQKYIERTFKR